MGPAVSNRNQGGCMKLFVKSLTLSCIVVLSLGLLGQTAAPAKAAKVSPMHPLAWVVGGVWTADMSKMGNGMKSIETRYDWSDNNAYVRFNTHFVSDKGVAKTYDGNFYFDPAKKSLQMWYMDSSNTIYEGPIKVDGDLTTFDFRGEDFEGKMSDL